MSQEPHREVAFSEIEEDRLPEGNRISRLAAFSLLLGLASIASLAGPVGALFSFAAVALGIAALRRIASSEVPLLGRKAAILGLALGLFFGAWGLVGHHLHERLITARARACGDNWLEMVREKRLYQAHQMLLSRGGRQSPDKSLAEYYTVNETAAENFRDFTREEPLRSILEAGESAEFEFEGPVSVLEFKTSGVYEDTIRLRYLLRAADESNASQGVPFVLKMIRTRIRGEPGESWRVDGVQAPKDGPT